MLLAFIPIHDTPSLSVPKLHEQEKFPSVLVQVEYKGQTVEDKHSSISTRYSA